MGRRYCLIPDASVLGDSIVELLDSLGDGFHYLHGFPVVRLGQFYTQHLAGEVEVHLVDEGERVGVIHADALASGNVLIAPVELLSDPKHAVVSFDLGWRDVVATTVALGVGSLTCFRQLKLRSI